MMTPAERPESSDFKSRDYELQHPWLERFFHPWTVALMMGCLALAMAELLALFYPSTIAAYFVITAMSGALLGYTVYRLGIATVPSESERRTMQTLVLVAAFIILKVLSFLVEAFAAVNVGARLDGALPVSLLIEPWLFFAAWSAELEKVVTSHLALWAMDPREFFDLTTLAGFAFFGLAWSVAIATARDFGRIGVPTEDRQEKSPLQTITRRFLVGGMVLMLSAGVARTDLWYPLVLDRPPILGLIANVLLYTTLGFTTVAHTHLLTRVRRWQSERAHIADDLAQRWLRYTVLFILGVAVLSAVLPTGFTVPLLTWGRWLLWGALIVGTFLFYLLNVLLWPLAWLFSWISRRIPPEAPSFDALPPPMAENVFSSAETAAPQMLVLRTLAVLALLFAGLVLVFRRYLQEHPEVRTRLGWSHPSFTVRFWLRHIIMWLQGFWHRAQVPLKVLLGERRSAGALLASLRQTAHRREPETPREQVIAAYLLTLKTAAAAGTSRRNSQTPDEYGEVLKVRLPAVEEAIEELTEDFDEARYSAHLLTTTDVERANTHARTIAAALKLDAAQ